MARMALLLAMMLLMAIAVGHGPAQAQQSQGKGADGPLIVQLKWHHQFQFAGFYAAETQGFFKDEGLDVRLVEGGPTVDPVAAVVSGGAVFGVGNSTLIIEREGGQPVVAVVAYTSTEPYFAIRADIPIRIFDPRDIGIDFYGDTLFTTRRFADDHPDTVRAMRRAVIRGWKYALAHQDDIISYILGTYAPGDDRTHLGFEAQITKDPIGTDLANIGYMSLSRWTHIADVFSKAGLMPTGAVPDDFLFEETEPLPRWIYQWLTWLTVLAVLASFAAYRYYRLSKELGREIARRRKLEEDLRILATTDPLSGLANRRHLEDRARAEIARSRRHDHDLGVILLDLNQFKHLNDTYGHAFGDRCIRAVAEACASVLRDIDLAARFGGDEFLIMLPETSPSAARTVADRLRRTIAGLTIEPSDQPLSASLGLGFLMPEDSTLDDIVARADADMYRDKRARG